MEIQFVIQNNFISDKHFEDTHTTYLASKPVDIFMGSDTDTQIQMPLIHFLIQF